MKEPKIVPSKLSDPINYKMIILIIGGMIALHVLINYMEDSRAVVYGWSMSIPFAIFVMSFVTVKKYGSSLVFSKAFKFLGISFIGILVFYLCAGKFKNNYQFSIPPVRLVS